MTKFAMLGAAAFLTITTVMPAAAQEVISNPGYCAQFYPNANCQNKGPNNPYNGDYQLRKQINESQAWGANPCMVGAEFYIGRGGRRHACN